MPEIEGTSEAIILIKAAPRVGKKHGETVCCAGVTPEGKWLRLFPVDFRNLKKEQRFGRWSKITCQYGMPRGDSRPESRRIIQETIQICGEIRKSEREKFLSSLEVTSLDKELEQGRTLALLRPKVHDFFYEEKSKEDLEKEIKEFEDLHNQMDLFTKGDSKRKYSPPPYNFKYRYETDDGIRTGTCQDWEINATYYNWSLEYGEKEALEKICDIFGKVYPEKGMVLAMGTHSLHPNTWLINGIIRLDESTQGSLF